MKTGLLYFHLGWTDIINSLALIDYYNKKYDKLIVLMIIASKPLVEYYIKNKKNIEIIYLNITNRYDFGNSGDLNLPIYLLKNYSIDIEDNKYDLLFHGHHDRYRTDQYKRCFILSSAHYFNDGIYFVNGFYTKYDIEYINRIECFNLNRDIEIETQIYNDFIIRNGENYVLYHEIIEIEKQNKIKYINLALISTTFFDYIKVLEKSMEIHLIDSVWAAIIYILNCKYRLFESIQIFLYAKRGHNKMFTEPYILPNWTIIYF
jgi:hypothetical protein